MKENLPHFSYIFHKPDPLGTDFNTVDCYITGSLILIEAQIVNKGMNNRKYQQQLGATESCTKIMMEATKGIVLKDIKGATKDCLLFSR